MKHSRSWSYTFTSSHGSAINIMTPPVTSYYNDHLYTVPLQIIRLENTFFTLMLSFFTIKGRKWFFLGSRNKIQPTHFWHCFFVQLVKRHLTFTAKVVYYRWFFYLYHSLYSIVHNNLKSSTFSENFFFSICRIEQFFFHFYIIFLFNI